MISAISAKRQHGRFYTPAAVADLVLSLTVGDRWPPSRILDPSCGDGALLAAAVRRGLPASRMVGRDNDRGAIASARSSMPGARFDVVDLFAPSEERFPAIVGNPPYVRRERLDAETKERISACLGQLLGGIDGAELLGRGDIAACALLRSAALLESGGRIGFVVSAALLDADYAQPMWRALGRLGVVRDIVSAPRERWFAEAAVNTIIVVFERGATGSTRVARLERPTSECATSIACADDIVNVADVRLDDSRSPRRWAHLLRAPSLWLELESSPSLVALGEVAEIRRGMTSGANDIFYFTAERARALSIEPEALSPLVRSPARGDIPIAIEPTALNDFVLRAPTELSCYPGVAAYLNANRDASARPTLRVRQPWWKLPSRPARLFLAKAYARRFVQRLAPRPLDCDQRVYAVWPRGTVDVELCAAILNGSATALAIEALGRASMGEGALEWTVADAQSLPVIDPRLFSGKQLATVLRLFTAIANRPIGPSEAEANRADRRALDAALTQVDPLLAERSAALAADVARSAASRAARAAHVGC